METMNEYKSKYESLDINYFEFFNVGRKTCKNYGISADSLMQLCFQVNTNIGTLNYWLKTLRIYSCIILINKNSKLILVGPLQTP